MKKKERMKIYTLLFGALVVCPMQAQTVHDWENHHVLQINRKPARAAFIPFSTQKGDCSVCLDGMWKFRWTPVPDERIEIFIKRILMIRTGLIFRFLLIGKSTDMVLQFMYQPVIHLR